jgi:hypothetical protein
LYRYDAACFEGELTAQATGVKTGIKTPTVKCYRIEVGLCTS